MYNNKINIKWTDLCFYKVGFGWSGEEARSSKAWLVDLESPEHMNIFALYV